MCALGAYNCLFEKKTTPSLPGKGVVKSLCYISNVPSHKYDDSCVYGRNIPPEVIEIDLS